MENVLNKLFDSLKLGEARSFKNLTIFPIISNKPAQSDYQTIDDVLHDNSVVKIMEVSKKGDVPCLKLINRGGKKVLILDGEELIGAKQDRVASSTLLAPDNDEIIIPVSCVERNRWNYKSDVFHSENRRAYFRLRKKIFVTSKNNRYRKLKLHPQHHVWKDIDSKMTNMHVKSPTSSMSDIYKKYLKELGMFSDKIKKDEGQIGMIAFINNKPVGCEIFSDPKMLESYYSKVISSYALDAIEESQGASRRLKTLRKRALSFLNEVRYLQRSEHDSTFGLGMDVILDSDLVHGSALKYNDKIVYMSLFSKLTQ